MRFSATTGLSLLVLFCASTALAQQSHDVTAAQNSLLDAIAMAAPGDTLVLVDDGGAYQNDDELRIEMPLTIMAAPGLMNKPVLTNNGDDGTKDIIRMYDDLTLIGLEFDGLADTDKFAKYAIRNSSGSDQANLKQGYKLKVFDCYFHDIVAGSDGNAFRAYYDTMADSIIFRNVMVKNTGKEAIRVRDEDNERPGFGFFNVNYFEVSNSTFWDIKNDAISVYGGDEDPNTPGPEVVIDHVTMHNVGHYFINLKDVENARVTNTIMVNNYDIVNATNKTMGAPWLVPGSYLGYSDTLNVSDDGDWTGDRGDPDIEMLYDWDPMFADPYNGDFTLVSGSPAIGAGMNGASLGDPRWAPAVTQVAAGQNTLLDAVNNASAGDVIILTDSGGEYLHDASRINVRVPLTIRAADGLAERPVIKANGDQSTKEGFRVYNSLHLDNIEIDGQAGTDLNAKYLIRIDGDVEPTTVLKVTNSYLHDVVAGSDGNFLRQYAGTYADSVIFRNSILSGSGKEGIRIKDESTDTGLFNVGYFEVSNTTITNTRVSAIYVYAGDADPATPEPEFVVNNLTCYNCGHGNGRAIYPRGFQNATITNSIFANSLEGEEFSVKLEGNSMISHSNLWMVSPVVLNGTSTATDMLNVDPMFRDPTNMDFWIAESSELRTAGSTGMGIGDMRWIAGVTSVDPEPIALPIEPTRLLGQNYPNPFRSETTIPYRIDVAGHVTLEVFDLLGRQIARTDEGHRTAGEYTLLFTMPQQAAAGTYFYRLRVDDRVDRRPFVLAR